MTKSISTKAALKLDNTRFTIKGITSYERDENNIYKPRIFKTRATLNTKGEIDVSIYEDKIFGDGMNVGRFGSSKLSLYSYTPFNKRVNDTIRYSDIEILELGIEPASDIVVLERANNNK